MTERATGCGIGLRREHYNVVLAERPDVSWFEVISENFVQPGGRPRHVLGQVRENYPVALHGVSLSLGSDEPQSDEYLRRLRELVAWVEPCLVSDHLCWTALEGRNSHDLLPLPHNEDAVRVAAANIRRVQDALGRRILVENISTYLELQASEMKEWEFVSAVLEAADCDLLLDVNNVYVNARNHGFDAKRYVEAIPAERVRQIHLAGHEDHGGYIIDTHDHPVCEDVWELYGYAIERFGDVPTLIERDDRIPELPVLLDEAGRATQIMEASRAVARI